MTTYNVGTFKAGVEVDTSALKVLEQESARYAKAIADNNYKEALAAENNVRAALGKKQIK